MMIHIVSRLLSKIHQEEQLLLVEGATVAAAALLLLKPPLLGENAHPLHVLELLRAMPRANLLPQQLAQQPHVLPQRAVVLRAARRRRRRRTRQAPGRPR